MIGQPIMQLLQYVVGSIHGKQGEADQATNKMLLTRERLLTWMAQRFMILFKHEPVLARETKRNTTGN